LFAHGGIMGPMFIRKANRADLPEVIRLAKTCNLDYEGMEADAFLVAEEGGRILGICGLKKHPECLELCALGVGEEWRGSGYGKRLVRAALREEPGEIYLATVIPGFFAPFGFEKAASVPPSMVKKQDWCAGCRPELCTVMMKKGKK
jgi:N-acetylglutamate synthase-like GNAT family acetyltransferase